MIEITEADFSIEGVVEKARSEDVGAIVTFLGTVRNDGIKSMELEAYKEAAIPELERIRDEAIERFHLKSVDIIHRVGSFSVGYNNVLNVCAAGHIKEAFD
jgi:molybdopterin synthase catalytic subunit